MNRDERELLAATVRAALASATDTGADAVLAGLGWPEMLAAEPDAAVAVVCNALGHLNATATVLDDVVTHALGAGADPDMSVLLPRFTASALAAHDERAVAGLASARVASASRLLVVLDGAASVVDTEHVTVQAVHGIDPDAGLHAVRVPLDAVRRAPSRELAAGAWDGAVAWARRALAHELAGASWRMLELAREHALERVQFGRPVAGFQAVRHRLAEALVAVEALDAVVAAAATEPGVDTAALAKAVAGRTARVVAGHAQQVLAGIGFTTDHAFHRYLKRTIVLEGLFGSPEAVTRELGRLVLATRSVPVLVDL